jgi:hypothetical protein
MSDTILVSTRKGLFVLERGVQPWSVKQTAFLGDNVALSLADPRDGAWYAVLDLGHFGNKLQRSRDRGVTWQEIAVPAFGDAEQVITGDGKPPLPATLRLIWALEAGGPDQPGRLWAGTIPGGLFRSDDHGDSWHLVRGLWDRPERLGWFGGGYDQPGIHSICVDPRDARCVSVGISTGGVWHTQDGGDTWAQGASGMRAEYLPPEQSFDPHKQDVHHMVQCPAAPDTLWVQHHNGVFRSDNGGTQWHEVENVPPSVFGFAVAVHPREPGTAWFVPARKDQARVPVEARVVVARTRDRGRSFDVLREGLPQEQAYDLTYRHALAVDRSGDRLAFGTTTGGFWISEDQGDRWQMLSARLPPVYAVSFA